MTALPSPRSKDSSLGPDHLDGAALDQTLAALRAMPTQTDDALATLGDERFAEVVGCQAFVAARTSAGQAEP